MSTATAAQGRYIADLARKLGYASVYDMWAEYGYMEQTVGGLRPRSCSKTQASALIIQLKARVSAQVSA